MKKLKNDLSLIVLDDIKLPHLYKFHYFIIYFLSFIYFFCEQMRDIRISINEIL